MLNPQLMTIASQVFNVPEADLTLETGVRNLEAWTSMAHMRLMVELEQAFHMRFSIEQISKLTNLARIQSVLIAQQF